MRGVWLALAAVALTGCGAGKSEFKTVEGRPDIATIQAGDPEIDAAVARAKKELPAFIKHWQKPDKEMDGFLVKKRFDVPGGAFESMWIEVEKYEGGVFHGMLNDEPEYINTIKRGDSVDVPEEEVIDWAIFKNGKLAVGAYTDEVQKRRLKSPGN